MWRLRRITERGWNDGFHINTKAEAEGLCELLNKLEGELTEAREQRDEAREQWRMSSVCRRMQSELEEAHKEGEEQARLLGMGSEREAKLIAERDLWRAEAQRWREQALDLEAQIETAIKRIQWRQDNLDRGIKELKGDY